MRWNRLARLKAPFVLILSALFLVLSTGLIRAASPLKDIKNVTKPMEEAMTKTAEIAAREARKVAEEAHTLGGKILQGLINVMIAASPGKTRVYLPAPSSNPNTGLTIGVLPVFLFVDKKEVIRHILAPSLTYNRFFGVNATMRYYWYPTRESQLFTIGSYSVETNRRFTFRYENRALLDDRIYFKIDTTFVRDGSLRFFGLGPHSDFKRQSNYTLRDNRIEILTGVNFLERLRFTLGHRFRDANVVDGPISSLPKITRFSPRPAGVENSREIVTQSFSISYDSRDLPIAPIQGHLIHFFWEHAGRIGGDTRYERMGTNLRGFYPARDGRFITGMRFLFDGENGGEEVPFYERALLGGKDSLRGFGTARFVDRYRTSFSIEERIRFYTLKAFNVNIDFEITPFFETGTVFANSDSFRFSDLHHVGGVGFRSVVRPNVVGIIDIGFGEEGSTLYVGIDYPF